MSNTKQFSREQLDAWRVDWGIGDPVVLREFLQQRRWETDYRVVFRAEDALWEVIVSEGSTEMQDSDPYNGEDPVTCYRVREVQRTVTDYVRVTDE